MFKIFLSKGIEVVERKLTKFIYVCGYCGEGPPSTLVFNSNFKTVTEKLSKITAPKKILQFAKNTFLNVFVIKYTFKQSSMCAKTKNRKYSGYDTLEQLVFNI